MKELTKAEQAAFNAKVQQGFRGLAKLGYVIAYAKSPTDGRQDRFAAQWVEIAVAVAQAAIKYSEEQNFKSWRSDVSSKLDVIVDQLQQIQAQLQEMKVWFDERISEETRRQYVQSIQSLTSDTNRILNAIGDQSNLPTPDQLNDLKSNFRDLRLTISRLCITDGYGHVYGVLSGIVTTYPLFTLLGRKSELADWASEMVSYLDNAVSGSNPKSLETARNSMATEYLQTKAIFDARIGVRYTTNFDAGGDNLPIQVQIHEPHPIHTPNRAIVQTPGGSIESGIFRAGLETVKGKVPPWYPELRERYDMGDGDQKPWWDIERSLSVLRDRCIYLDGKQQSLSQLIGEIGGVAEELRKHSGS